MSYSPSPTRGELAPPQPYKHLGKQPAALPGLDGGNNSSPARPRSNSPNNDDGDDESGGQLSSSAPMAGSPVLARRQRKNGTSPGSTLSSLNTSQQMLSGGDDDGSPLTSPNADRFDSQRRANRNLEKTSAAMLDILDPDADGTGVVPNVAYNCQAPQGVEVISPDGSVNRGGGGTSPLSPSVESLPTPSRKAGGLKPLQMDGLSASAKALQQQNH